MLKQIIGFYINIFATKSISSHDHLWKYVLIFDYSKMYNLLELISINEKNNLF